MFKKIMNQEALWIGEQCGVVVDGIRVLIVHTEAGISAFHDECPHAGALLSEGWLKDEVITCARHQWQFDAKTGKGLNPCDVRLHQYQVYVDEANDIWVDIGK